MMLNTVFKTLKTPILVPTRLFNLSLPSIQNKEKGVKEVEKLNKYILYGDDISPPVRFVLMTASVLDVALDFRKVDLFANEHKREDYKEINRLQKVPTLEVNRKFLSDSHAISLFLCEKSKDNNIYPTNDFVRAKINEWLFYNATTLFPIDSLIFCDFFKGTQISEIMESQWYSALDHLEFHLTKNAWLAGDKMRLCDLCCAATVTSLQVLIPLHHSHKMIEKWIRRLNELPCFEINKAGVLRLQQAVDSVKMGGP